MPAKKHAKARSKKTFDTNLLGPCAFNCGYCLAYKKKTCLGCRYQADKRRAEGVENWCPLLNCADERGITMCCECTAYPCMKHYDPDKNGMYSWNFFNYIKNEIKPDE